MPSCSAVGLAQRVEGLPEQRELVGVLADAPQDLVQARGTVSGWGLRHRPPAHGYWCSGSAAAVSRGRPNSAGVYTAALDWQRRERLRRDDVI